jgi:hypothetical protein
VNEPKGFSAKKFGVSINNPEASKDDSSSLDDKPPQRVKHAEQR